MIRKRDFILFLHVVAFLVVAITMTTLYSIDLPGQGMTEVQPLFESTTASYTATIVESVDLKPTRLAALQAKLRDRGEIISALDNEPTVEEPVVSGSKSATTTTEIKDAPLRCASYRAVTVEGLNGVLTYVERGTSRIFYTLAVTGSAQSTSTGLTISTTSVEKIVLSLPLRTIPLPFASCIPTDIVAVTLVGAPIRNTEYAQFKGVSEAVLIGYTLDGFPLYGQTNNLETDACGGRLVDGAYRYYLSPQRDAVVGCFVGIPVNL
jgi:hypothetical protein